ncbi:MAG: GatB/YqeY domain-containing protein [Bacilli bacterium]|nr:GatB/YqeY domain-containing protein [Bacilli bacterium]
MLIDELQKANIEALKSGNKVARAILSVVIAKYKASAIELKASGKEATDADMVKIITKSIKELDEEKEGYAKVGRNEEVSAIDSQKALIEKYLPKLMSEDEIRNIIASLEDKSMPSVMKHFKMNYDGQVDMSVVSKIARGQ